MSLYEYDQEEHIRLEREDAYEEGREEGMLMFIKAMRNLKLGADAIVEQLIELYQLDESTARQYMEDV